VASDSSSAEVDAMLDVEARQKKALAKAQAAT